MELEDAFAISIADGEAAALDTPGDIIALVMAKVAKADATGCQTQHAFHLLRAALRRHLPLQRKVIVPAAPLATLVPNGARQAFLAQLAAELKTGPLPALVRPPWLVSLLTALSLSVGIAVAYGTLPLFSYSRFTTGLASAAAALIAGLMAGQATRSCRTEFPPLVATAGDLARCIMAHQASQPAIVPAQWTREQVAQRVREIVVEHLNCASVYREDASLIKDLGMDN